MGGRAIFGGGDPIDTGPRGQWRARWIPRLGNPAVAAEFPRLGWDWRGAGELLIGEHEQVLTG